MAGASKEEGPGEPKRIGGTNVTGLICSFAKKIGAVAAIYLLGYFDFSIAWVIAPVMFSVIRDEWKKEKEMKRNIAKAAALCQEKEVILARVDDLPSWVYFPDVERVEWLNKIIRQVWPNVNHYAKDLLKNSIEPSVRDSLVAYKLNGFKFEKMVLGSIPLRLGGVKVYDHNVSRNEIILDTDLFYAGDCDISFSLGGIKGGIKDLQLHGMMRVVMKPLITDMPLVGGLQIFFLNNPTIDFNLVGVADLLDMPGISDILRRIIVETVAHIMVLPNKLPIQLSDSVPARSLKMPEPEGVLRIHVVEAKDLMKKDIGMLGKGKSDPYAIINVGTQDFRTQTIDNTVNPKWDFWCESIVFDSRSQELQARLFDRDDTSEDESLGRATVEINTVTKKGVADEWLTLEGAKHGMLHVRLTWLKLTSDVNDLHAAIAETQTLRLTTMSTAVLMVFIDCARNLPNARANSKPDPFVNIIVGKKQERTNSQFRTGDPVFEQGFTFLVHNPENDTMHIKVVDQKTNLEIGQLVYNLSSLLKKSDMQEESQPFRLAKSGPDSKLHMSVELKILKHADPEPEVNDVENNGKLDKDSAALSRTGSIRNTDSQSSTSVNESPLKQQDSAETLSRGASVKSTGPQLSVEEIMTVSTAPPFVESAPPDLRNRAPSSTSSAGESGLGRIQLTMRYSMQRQKLVIVVHRIANLPLKDPSNIPDPYVKLYLLPERSKETKRKTEVMKDNCHPVYDETFEYLISQAELNSRQLEVSVITRKGFLQQSPTMGQVLINLSDYDLSKAVTLWFDLHPEFSKDA